MKTIEYVKFQFPMGMAKVGSEYQYYAFLVKFQFPMGMAKAFYWSRRNYKNDVSIPYGNGKRMIG